ncbi:putative protein phosphatase 2C 39 [Drosera capensis]
MKGKKFLHKVQISVLLYYYNAAQEKVCMVGRTSSGDAGVEEMMIQRNVTHGFHLVEGKSHHSMEDYLFAEIKQVDSNELGLYAIFDGHASSEVPNHLRSHLFDNILKEPDFWTETENAIRSAYHVTDTKILEKSRDLGRGGSTAVTAILINHEKLIVANVGDSRAVICRNGTAKQLSVDHEPSKERKDIEERGGFVLTLPGDVARVDGQLAVARAFGDKSLKEHLSSEPDVLTEMIDDETEFILLASDGIWHVMSNQEAIDRIKDIKDPQAAAERLVEEALSRKSTDDISVIVVRFS